MLKKLLPFQKSQKSQKQKPKKVVKKLPKSKHSDSVVTHSKSPNLLMPIDTGNYLARSSPHIVSVTAYVVHITALIFVLMALANYFFNLQLSKLSMDRDLLISDIEVSANVTNKAKEVVNLISVYKGAKSENPTVHSLMSSAFDLINRRVTIESLSYQRANNSIIFVSQSAQAIDYAFLITELLELERVENIMIKAVDLQHGALNGYVATLEINLK